MKQRQRVISWTLRISCTLCLIGHGAWGVITKADWLPFFSLFSIDRTVAYRLMPLIGLTDITTGLIILFKPMRGILVGMFGWAVWTALLRPLAGMGWWEFLERAGNYGAPFAYLCLSGFPARGRPWFTRIEEPSLTQEAIRSLTGYLRIFTALLMIGHGGFGAFQHKELLINHFRALGLTFATIDPRLFITCFGYVEIALGLSVLLKPMRPMLLGIVIWKVLTELLYPLSGHLVWEFIERGGSYGVPLSLYVLCGSSKKEIKP